MSIQFLVCAEQSLSPELIWTPALPGCWCPCFRSSPLRSQSLEVGSCLRHWAKHQKHHIPSNILFSGICVSFSSTGCGLQDSHTHVSKFWGYHLHSKPVSDHRKTEQHLQKMVEYLRISNQADNFYVSLLTVGGQSLVILYLLPFWFSFFLLNRAWAGDRQHHPALYSQCDGTMCRSWSSVLCLDNSLFWQNFPPALPTWGSDWSHISTLWFEG